MLVGGIGILDLRLAGLFRRIPVEALSSALTPIALAGLVLMIPSGATMFAADAAALVNSATFRLKLISDRTRSGERNCLPDRLA